MSTVTPWSSKTDTYVERVLFSRVVLALWPKTVKEVRKTVKTLTYAERIVGYSALQAVNNTDVTTKETFSETTAKEYD